MVERNAGPEHALCGRVFRVFETRDGKKIRIRGVCPGDKEGLVRFYERLSLETIYTRFFSIIRYFEPYVDKLIRGNALVVIAEDMDTGDIVGVAEAIPQGDKAEGGIVVLETYQGRGIGMAMARALNKVLWERGVRAVVGYILPDNVGAFRLVKRLGGEIKRYYESMVLAEIPVRADERDKVS